jgi:hypothetical protein
MAQGDNVTVSGVVTEFGAASQATEYSGLDYQFENSTGQTLPAPVVVTPGQVGVLAGSEPFSGEKYEAMLVRMNNVVVDNDSLPNGQYLVGQYPSGSDTCRIDDNIYHHLYRTGVSLNVTGVVNDAFGQYVVLPRDAADVESLTVQTGVEPGGAALGFAIRGISPTPVSFASSVKAVLSFNLPTAGKVSARVYDINGRLVSEPASQVSMAAGPQSLAIDGKTLSGGRLGSGIFFVQLRFENKVATGKLVVTE